MAKPIEGKVAKIIDEQTIILNVGSQAGVLQNMRFDILATGEQVQDPDTGEPLGKWELVKGSVRATHVQDRLTVCTALPGEGAPSIDPATHTLSAELTQAHMLNPAARTNTPGKLTVNPAQIDGKPAAAPIALGDKVRSVPE